MNGVSTSPFRAFRRGSPPGGQHRRRVAEQAVRAGTQPDAGAVWNAGASGKVAHGSSDILHGNNRVGHGAW